MSLYAAIDLHSTNSVLVVIDEKDKVLRRRKLPNELPAIARELKPFKAELAAIAIESTYNWYWLVDGLKAKGYPVRLANTAAIKQYEGLKHGNDDSDAFHLAQLLRLGILPEGYIYPREQRPLRDLLRRRFQLVRQSVELMQSVQASFARATGQCLSANDFRALDGDAIERAFPDPTNCYAVLAQAKVWCAQREQIERIETWIHDDIRRSPELAGLNTVPGIGAVLGSTILLETGPISRFASVGHYASYCRMVKTERLSNGKRKGSGNAKCGNRYLAWAYIEAANFMLRYSEAARRWYQRKLARSMKVVALKALAHKIARACFFILRDGVAFEEHKVFG